MSTPPPKSDEAQPLVCGTAARPVDSEEPLGSHPPLALILNVVGPGATLGVMTWTSQDGSLSSPPGFTAQPTEASMTAAPYPNPPPGPWASRPGPRTAATAPAAPVKKPTEVRPRRPGTRGQPDSRLSPAVEEHRAVSPAGPRTGRAADADAGANAGADAEATQGSMRRGWDSVTWSTSETLIVAFIVQVPGRGRLRSLVAQ